MGYTMVKKIILLMLSIVLLTLGLTIIPTKAKADDDLVYLQLQEFRQPELDTPGAGKEMAYRSLNNKIMWKISVTNDEAGKGSPDRYRAIYCIKAGAGFGFSDNSANGQTRAYTKAFNLKNLASIPQAYAKVLFIGMGIRTLICTCR